MEHWLIHLYKNEFFFLSFSFKFHYFLKSYFDSSGVEHLIDLMLSVAGRSWIIEPDWNYRNSLQLISHCDGINNSNCDDGVTK